MNEKQKRIWNIINVALFIIFVVVLALGIAKDGIGSQENSKSPSELMLPDIGTKK